MIWLVCHTQEITNTLKTELKSMEGRLMSIQAEIGTLRFNQTPGAV